MAQGGPQPWVHVSPVRGVATVLIARQLLIAGGAASSGGNLRFVRLLGSVSPPLREDKATHLTSDVQVWKSLAQRPN